MTVATKRMPSIGKRGTGATSRCLSNNGVGSERMQDHNQISDRLCISPATVKRHTEDIYHKLGVPDRRKAVAKAMGLAIIRSS